MKDGLHGVSKRGDVVCTALGGVSDEQNLGEASCVQALHEHLWHVLVLGSCCQPEHLIATFFGCLPATCEAT